MHRAVFPDGLGAEGGTRVLVVALDGLASMRYQSLVHGMERSLDLRRLAGHGGSGLALAAFGAAARDRSNGESGLLAPAFAISAGDAVRRGLPTAARATIIGRAPLRRGVVEAPFGGGFARAFVQRTDVLLVFGTRSPARWWIGIDEAGGVSLRQATLGPAATTGERALAWTAGGAHALLVGPAAEAGLPFANLGSWDAGAAAPSLVGRGGLGATVARAGLVAVAVHGGLPETPDVAAPAVELSRALESSPRLVARAHGGTLELVDVRGEAVSGGGAHPSPKTRHGCKGCPTPCGWQFEASVSAAGEPHVPGSKVGGRFAALQGFLRSTGRDSALGALACCNDLGMDARTAALLLADEAPDPSQLLDPSSPLHHRALALAPEDDREPARALMPSDLAARVGVELGARGPEPLRSLSVLGLRANDTVDAATRAQWERDFRMGGLTDDEVYNAGVIAHWQECYAAALDHSGFCAFSGSALIADGALGLDALAHAVTSSMDGAEWLALGAQICALHRELRERSLDEEVDLSALDLPQAAVRGYVEAVHGYGSAPAGSDSQERAPADLSGRVLVRASGLLASKLRGYPGARELVEPGTGRSLVEMELDVGAGGASVDALLARIVEALPAAARWLHLPGGGPLPAVLIAGRGAAGARVVGGGETVELLLVIPGG